MKMTHTTTDAAEARALPVIQADRDAAEAVYTDLFSQLRDQGHQVSRKDRVTPDSDGLIQAFAGHRLATAEAASGAGVREADALREALYRAAVDLLHTPRHNRDGAADQHIKESRERIRQSLYPSLPPATDPVRGLDPETIRRCAQVADTEISLIFSTRANGHGSATARSIRDKILALAATGEAMAVADAEVARIMVMPDEQILSEASAEDIEWARKFKAALQERALAAAPTIPATGEAIPEGMKPWHGGNGPPNDWDGGEVLLENEQMGDGNVWDHHPSRSPSRIVAYTPKASIPATGHASTVDPDDLRPWGYAPGEYLFRCIDCPPDRQIVTRTIGDKRSWRCKPHAEAARDASGHAATEGEGA